MSLRAVNKSGGAVTRLTDAFDHRDHIFGLACLNDKQVLAAVHRSSQHFGARPIASSSPIDRADDEMQKW